MAAKSQLLQLPNLNIYGCQISTFMAAKSLTKKKKKDRTNLSQNNKGHITNLYLGLSLANKVNLLHPLRKS